MLLVLIAIAGAAVYWAFLRTPPGTTNAAPTKSPCPTLSASAPSTAPIKSVHVQVLNSTNQPGLAGKVSSLLKARGFPVTGVGNDSSAYAGTAEVRYGVAGLAAARTVVLQVPGARLVADKRTGAGVDLVLGQRYQRLSTAAEIVKAAKTAASSPAC